MNNDDIIAVVVLVLVFCGLGVGLGYVMGHATGYQQGSDVTVLYHNATGEMPSRWWVKNAENNHYNTIDDILKTLERR